MTDFDTAARQEAERRYGHPDADYEDRIENTAARAAFEAGARWGARPLNMTTLRATFARAVRAEAALAYFVIDGVCLTCGDGVLASGEHIDPDRHAAYRYTSEDIDYARDEARAGADRAEALLAEVAALHTNVYHRKMYAEFWACGECDYPATGPDDYCPTATLARAKRMGADR